MVAPSNAYTAILNLHLFLEIGPIPSYIRLRATVGLRRQQEDWRSRQKAAQTLRRTRT